MSVTVSHPGSYVSWDISRDGQCVNRVGHILGDKSVCRVSRGAKFIKIPKGTGRGHVPQRDSMRIQTCCHWDLELF